MSQFIQELSVWRASGGLLQGSFWRTARRCALSLNRDKKETLGEWKGRISKLCVQGAAEDGGIQEEYHTEGVTAYCLHWYVSHGAYSLPCITVRLCANSASDSYLAVTRPSVCFPLCLAGGKLRLRATQPISGKYVKHQVMCILNQLHTWFHSSLLFLLLCLIFLKFFTPSCHNQSINVYCI